MPNIRTSCPNGCKYISGGKCIASECPYQTGNVRYDIRMNNERLEKCKEQSIKEFAERLKQAICDNTYPYFDKNGKPVNIWNTDGFGKIDELLNGYIDGEVKK